MRLAAVPLAALGLAVGAESAEAAPVGSHASVYTCCMPLAQKERLFAESKAMGASYIRVDVELSGIWRGVRGSRGLERPGPGAGPLP